MRVVWVYRDYRTGLEKYRNKVHLNCELIHPRELKVFSGGIASWQALAPEVERVMYVDSSVYRFLEQQKLLSRFDEIHIVDFEQELDGRYPGIDFFAAPKLWAMTQQNQPFALVDTEAVLLKPFEECEELDLNRYNAFCYHETNPIHFTNWTEQDIEEMELLKEEIGEDGELFEPQSMVEAGFVNYLDPEIAKKVGEKILQICEKVCQSKSTFSKKWTFCEESLLISTLRKYLQEVGQEHQIKLHEPFLEGTQEIIEFSSPGYVKDVYTNWYLPVMSKLPYRDSIAKYDPYCKEYVNLDNHV